MTTARNTYYGRARYYDMAAKEARAMGETGVAAELCKQRDKVDAEYAKAGKSPLYRAYQFGCVALFGGMAYLTVLAFNSVPEKQYEPDGRQIIHLENYYGMGVDPCTSTVFSVYQNGKPVKCPTPQ